MSNCRKYMCDKGIHSDSAWIEHRIQLSKDYAPHYETHPDYIKTMKCRPDVIRKSDCELLFKDRPTSGAYLKKLNQYEFQLDKLKELKLNLAEVKDQLRHDKYNFLATQDALRDEPKRLKKLEDASKRGTKHQDQVEDTKEFIQQLLKDLPIATERLRKTEEHLQQVMRDIDAVKLSLKTKPMRSTRCPNGYKRNKTTKKCDKK